MTLPPDDLPCQELVELVTDYLEGRLPEYERRRFDAHLQGCSGCRNYLEHMRLMIGAVGALRAESIEPEMKERLLGAFRDWRQSGLPKEQDRDGAQCLHDTINHLNRNQINRALKFAGDGTGRGIRWKMMDLLPGS